MGNNLIIREAGENDFDFVVSLMCKSLSPYYGGDHKRHAERIFKTHISGGKDHIGFFSLLQKMFVAEKDGNTLGLFIWSEKDRGRSK